MHRALPRMLHVRQRARTDAVVLLIPCEEPGTPHLVHPEAKLEKGVMAWGGARHGGGVRVWRGSGGLGAVLDGGEGVGAFWEGPAEPSYDAEGAA